MQLQRETGKRARKREINNNYVITSQQYMETIKGMYMDQEKQYGLYKIERQDREIKKRTLTTMLY